jgi:hypothetical protein
VVPAWITLSRRRSGIRTPGAGAIFVATLLAAACDGGGGAIEAGGATLVQAPDLRFKWVGAGLPLHAAGISNGGTMAGGTFTISGPAGVTPLELTGEVDSTYEVFSAGNLSSP